MAGYTFNWKGADFIKKAEAAVPVALAAGAEQLQRQMKSNLQTTGPSKPGQMPGRRTGDLYGSIGTMEVSKTLYRVGTPRLVGRWLDQGKFIKPKRGKYLAVPLNAKAERMYASLGVLGSGRASLRTKGKLKVIRSKSGALFLKEVTAKGKIVKNGAAFRLQTSTTILPRPWVKRSFYMAQHAIRDRMAKVFEKAMGVPATVTGGAL